MSINVAAAFAMMEEREKEQAKQRPPKPSKVDQPPSTGQSALSKFQEDYNAKLLTGRTGLPPGVAGTDGSFFPPGMLVQSTSGSAAVTTTGGRSRLGSPVRMSSASRHSSMHAPVQRSVSVQGNGGALQSNAHGGVVVKTMAAASPVMLFRGTSPRQSLRLTSPPPPHVIRATSPTSYQLSPRRSIGIVASSGGYPTKSFSSSVRSPSPMNNRIKETEKVSSASHRRSSPTKYAAVSQSPAVASRTVAPTPFALSDGVALSVQQVPGSPGIGGASTSMTDQVPPSCRSASAMHRGARESLCPTPGLVTMLPAFKQGLRTTYAGLQAGTSAATGDLPDIERRNHHSLPLRWVRH